jgi:hypothetical protein
MVLSTLLTLALLWDLRVSPLDGVVLLGAFAGCLEGAVLVAGSLLRWLLDVF